MCVHHGRFDIRMAEQFLDGADIVALLKQPRRKAMPEGMAAYRLRDPGEFGRRTHRLLQAAFIDMVPPSDVRAGVARPPFSGKDILPAPLAARAGVLPGQ